MARNPIARIRFWGHVALVTMVSLTIGGAFITSNYWDAFAWLIGFVAFGFGALLFLRMCVIQKKLMPPGMNRTQQLISRATSLGIGRRLLSFYFFLGLFC